MFFYFPQRSSLINCPGREELSWRDAERLDAPFWRVAVRLSPYFMRDPVRPPLFPLQLKCRLDCRRLEIIRSVWRQRSRLQESAPVPHRGPHLSAYDSHLPPGGLRSQRKKWRVFVLADNKVMVMPDEVSSTILSHSLPVQHGVSALRQHSFCFLFRAIFPVWGRVPIH